MSDPSITEDTDVRATAGASSSGITAPPCSGTRARGTGPSLSIVYYVVAGRRRAARHEHAGPGPRRSRCAATAR